MEFILAVRLSSVYKIQQNFVQILTSASEAKLYYTQLITGKDANATVVVSVAISVQQCIDLPSKFTPSYNISRPPKESRIDNANARACGRSITYTS